MASGERKASSLCHANQKNHVMTLHCTLLHPCSGHMDIVKFLIENVGCDPEVKNVYLNTPLYILIWTFITLYHFTETDTTTSSLCFSWFHL